MIEFIAVIIITAIMLCPILYHIHMIDSDSEAYIAKLEKLSRHHFSKAARIGQEIIDFKSRSDQEISVLECKLKRQIEELENKR
tara:strand:+ start:8318 stop:8569 length:252 start_codon:yes stop_codon:yes gene_type:complete